MCPPVCPFLYIGVCGGGYLCSGGYPTPSPQAEPATIVNKSTVDLNLEFSF